MMRCLALVPVLLVLGCGHSSPLAGNEPMPRPSPSGLPSADVPTKPAAKNEFEGLTRLTFQITGGFAGISDTLTIGGGRATLVKSHPATTTEVPFTADDLKQLAAILRDADFAHLVGDYRQKNLADGFSETVTAIVGAGKAQKTYVVSNYGDTAPAGFYKVTAYLRELQKTKFAPMK